MKTVLNKLKRSINLDKEIIICCLKEEYLVQDLGFVHGLNVKNSIWNNVVCLLHF